MKGIGSINISPLRDGKSPFANQKSKMSAMDGLLIIDKPAGMTSHDVVARVRKIIGERKIGHTGTLDPFATGVLVLLVGRATRIAQFLSAAEKEYEAVIRFGYATDTGDLSGARVETPPDREASPQILRGEQIESAIAALSGEIEQLPPMYSAKKIAGRKLYELARRGEEVARQPVHVTIHEFELLTDAARFSPNDDGSLDIRVRVVCSAGTYIRTLAEDLGKRLRIGAHLAELRRTRAGQFGIGAALTLEKLGEAPADNKLADALISPHAALSHLPSIDLDDQQLRRTLHGLALPLNDNDRTFHDGDSVRLSQNNQLIAVGKFDAQQRTIRPWVVLTIA
jgi:tRNA pseudouridine55 synthase